MARWIKIDVKPYVSARILVAASVAVLLLVGCGGVSVRTSGAPLQVTKVRWYLRGYGDAQFPGMGDRLDAIACAARSAGVVCRIRVSGYAAWEACSQGVFTIAGGKVHGKFSAPKPCPGQMSS